MGGPLPRANAREKSRTGGQAEGGRGPGRAFLPTTRTLRHRGWVSCPGHVTGGPAEAGSWAVGSLPEPETQGCKPALGGKAPRQATAPDSGPSKGQQPRPWGKEPGSSLTNRSGTLRQGHPARGPQVPDSPHRGGNTTKDRGLRTVGRAPRGPPVTPAA